MLFNPEIAHIMCNIKDLSKKSEVLIEQVHNDQFRNTK